MKLNKIFKDKDIVFNLLESKVISIIGYGNQGRAQALNLKDSKNNVIIGLREGSKSKELAKSDGFKVFSISKAVELSDVISILIPDEEIPVIFDNMIKPHLKKGKTLLFSHGYSIFFNEITPPDFINVILVAPSGSGKMVREEFIDGRGVPNLIAIDQDYTKNSLEIALSYSKSIGGTRTCAFLSTFEEEVVTDIFGEQVVLTGGIPSIIKESFNVLLEDGYSPVVAWFVCYYEVKSIIDSFHANGFDSLNQMISNIAEYGGLTRGERLINSNVKNEMKKILSEVKNGKFKKEWDIEKKKDFKLLNDKRKFTKESKIEKTTLKILSILGEKK
tara:strand:+ start:177 stop:1172 length:996 start_codon:yes stop_codon:yes gene_type:complete